MSESRWDSFRRKILTFRRDPNGKNFGFFRKDTGKTNGQCPRIFREKSRKIRDKKWPILRIFSRTNGQCPGFSGFPDFLGDFFGGNSENSGKNKWPMSNSQFFICAHRHLCTLASYAHTICVRGSFVQILKTTYI